MTVWEAAEGKEYEIQQVHTEDTELNGFLFSLGCYAGEKIGLIARRRGGCTVAM